MKHIYTKHCLNVIRFDSEKMLFLGTKIDQSLAQFAKKIIMYTVALDGFDVLRMVSNDEHTLDDVQTHLKHPQ